MGKSSREANGTDHCKQHRLHPSNQALLICRMIMDPKQPHASQRQHTWQSLPNQLAPSSALRFEVGRWRNKKRAREGTALLRNPCMCMGFYNSQWTFTLDLPAVLWDIRTDTVIHIQRVGELRLREVPREPKFTLMDYLGDSRPAPAFLV